MKSTFKTTLLISFFLLHFVIFNHASPIGSSNQPKNASDPIDPVEAVAKLLIQLDDMIRRVSKEQHEHLYMNANEVSQPPVDGVNSSEHEEKFSALLNELNKIEELISVAINKANVNRQYRLVMRLRPLMTYVNQIHRNMELLRTRVVAIATLSNLAVTVNDVLVQFGDVMTSSSVMASGIIPKDRLGSPTKTVVSSSSPSPIETTLSYLAIDGEKFFKNILGHIKK